jgi:universal stress protein E
MRKRIETVLIGTSLNEASDASVNSGLAVARAAGARIHLIHAFTPPLSYETASFAPMLQVVDLLEAQRSTLEGQLAAQIARLGIRSEELEAAGLVLGPAHRALIDIAHESRASLIVVGATESRGLAEIFGSTADRVARKADCPVLVVRGELAVPPARVLLAVDLSPLSAEAFRRGLEVLDDIAPVAEAHQAELEALFIMTDTHRRLFAHQVDAEDIERHAGRELDRFIRRSSAGLGWQVKPRMIGHGFAAEEILARVDEWRPDLVILGTHGGGGFERFLIGSVAADVVAMASSSVLVVPPAAAREEMVLQPAQVEAAQPAAVVG